MLGFAPVVVVESHGTRRKKLIERLLHGGKKAHEERDRIAIMAEKKNRSIITQKK